MSAQGSLFGADPIGARVRPCPDCGRGWLRSAGGAVRCDGCGKGWEQATLFEASEPGPYRDPGDG